jgi:maleylpyruvate isomerase
VTGSTGVTIRLECQAVYTGHLTELSGRRRPLPLLLRRTRSLSADTLLRVTGIDTPEWGRLADSAARFLGTAQALTGDDLGEASALPNWTRAHVLAHVAQTADSRTGLLRAAQAGRVGRQYPSGQARADAIEAGARRPAAVIRADVHRAVTECLTAIGEHPRQLWDAPAIWLEVGRRPVRRALPSLRRELEYHHVDLSAGYQPADWPDDFVAAELPRVIAMMGGRAGVPPMTLAGPGRLHIGASPPAYVTGSPAAILAWLSGRSDGSGLHADGAVLPVVPPLA